MNLKELFEKQDKEFEEMFPPQLNESVLLTIYQMDDKSKTERMLLADSYNRNRETLKSHIFKIRQETLEAVREEFLDYVEHDNSCIRSMCHAGRPTENGYEQKFGNKWYQSRPVDETPKCECGLDDLLQAIEEER